MNSRAEACDLQAFANRNRDLLVWEVCANPTDFPGKFTARPASMFHSTRESITFLDFVLVADTLDAVRKMLPPGLVAMQRHPTDPPQFVENWV